MNTPNSSGSLVRSLVNYIVLPAEVSAFEEKTLRRTNRVALIFFWCHLPIFIAVAAASGTGWQAAAVLTTVVLVGPTLAMRVLTPRTISLLYGFTAMCMGALLVHFGQGLVQMEMHFYFFVLIALLAVFANPMVIVVAAVTAAGHHAVFWLLLPESVFNYDAPFWVVSVHALFVVIESVAACFVARSFFDNVIGLDRLVTARTRELDSKNRDMRLILDTVKEGFVTVQRDGQMARERSAILDTWLGAPAGDSFFDWVARSDDSFAAWLRLSFDSLFDDVLPQEMALDQMPKRWRLETRTYALGYQLVGSQGAGGVLVGITDITDALRAQTAEDARNEMSVLVERLVRDRASVAEFIDEANSIVVALLERESRDSLQLRRLAHTLKGNAAFFGLRRLADAAHAYESALSDDSADADPGAIVSLWGETCDRVRPFLTDDGQLHVTDADIQHLRDRLHQGAGVDELLALVESLRAEPARRRLERMADAVRSVAGRLGKAVDVAIVADAHLRLPASLKGFWPAAVHLVRNAVDHGLEGCAEREAAGKPVTGRITLTARVDHDALLLTVADDGRGINWSKLQQRAAERGLNAQSHDELVELLFADGVSTRDEASDVSGRGVGMAAVREAALCHGGHIDVQSEPQQGTTITVTLPLHPGAPQEAALPC